MTRVGGVCGALMIAACAGGAAWAQYVPSYAYPHAYPYHVMPQRTDALTPDQILAIVRSMNFVPVARPVWTGPLYIVRATNRRGEVMRVVLDARSGALVTVRRASPLRAYFYTYAYRYDPYRRFWLDDEEDLLPSPPAPPPYAERRPDLPMSPPPSRQDWGEDARSVGTPPQRATHAQTPMGERRAALVPIRPPLPRPRPSAADPTDQPTAATLPSSATAPQSRQGPATPSSAGATTVAKTVEGGRHGSAPAPTTPQDMPKREQSVPPVQSFE
jgi:hypothetical protein